MPTWIGLDAWDLMKRKREHAARMRHTFRDLYKKIQRSEWTPPRHPSIGDVIFVFERLWNRSQLEMNDYAHSDQVTVTARRRRIVGRTKEIRISFRKYDVRNVVVSGASVVFELRDGSRISLGGPNVIEILLGDAK